MLSGLIRAILVIVIVVAVLVGLGAFFLGYRISDHPSRQPAGAVATSGRDAASTTAREKGAEIGARVGEAAGKAGEALSDGALTAKIKSKMALDDTLKAGDIHVSTSDKVVTLTGSVASSAQRDRAVQLARETEGVKSVNDRLALK